MNHDRNRKTINLVIFRPVACLFHAFAGTLTVVYVEFFEEDAYLVQSDLFEKLPISGGIFTGRVHIYYEDDFTPRQVADLTDLFAKRQESLVLRGGNYFVSVQNTRREAAAAK